MAACERCKKSQATFHLTNLDPGGGRSERHLCDKCAIEEGLLQVNKQVVPAEMIEQFVAATKAGAAALSNLVCEQCGISYVEFRNHGQLGCPHDYDAFRDVLTPLIERVHEGATHHTGKSPRSAVATRSDQQELRRLRRQLEEAVAAEDYERAAELRDRLRALEKP